MQRSLPIIWWQKVYRSVTRIKKGKGLEDLTIPEFRQFSEVVGDDVYEILSLQSCLNKRCAKGGVSPLRVAEAIAEAKVRFCEDYNETAAIRK